MITIILPLWLLIYIASFAFVKTILEIYSVYLTHKLKKLETEAKALRELSSKYSDHA